MAKRAIVVGSGPNGLTAAVELARRGVEVTVLEAREAPGGGAKTEALTLPGFAHDACSAVHPMAVCSPAFASMPLAEHGLRWIQPPLPLAHPLDGGRAAVLERSVGATAARLGRDGARWKRAVSPLVERWDELMSVLLAPIRAPRHPLLLARFGALAPWPASWAARALFSGEEARALLGGLAAHSVLPLESFGSGAIGWVIGMAGHAVGWPIPEGGSGRIAAALASYLRSVGGKLETGAQVRSLADCGGADAVLLDVSPRRLLDIAGDELPAGYRAALSRYRYGPGVFKLDWALSGPIPWSNADCGRAATVHVGGTLEELCASERAPWEGRASDKPFVLVAQPSVFDPTRAPAGKHTAWAYCHVPSGSAEDMTARVEAQLERFAPGFGARILARHAMGPAELERRNPNLVGGDITGGANDLRQTLLRPTLSGCRTPRRGLYLCSASTPPGGGVHGMCGLHAARAALADLGLA